ncbi:hypothetical protein ACU4GD_45535 [Cupriavidus basilensis]
MYSFSACCFGATGLAAPRVIRATHQDNIFDLLQIAGNAGAARSATGAQALPTTPSPPSRTSLKFIDRLVADSRARWR